MPKTCLTLQATNRFAFTCPIFGATVELRGCFHLHEKQMVSERVETRQGCQVAMSASKCPVWHIQQRLLKGEDEWHSAEPKVGSLGEGIIERIERIQIRDSDIKRYEPNPRELELLEASNSMWEKGAKKASKFTKSAPLAPVPVPAVTKPADDALIAAASSGSLSAAINAAVAAKEKRAGGTSAAPKTKPRSRAA